MKARTSPLLLLIAVTVVSGCQSYIYRVVRPSGVAQPIASQTVTVQYDPLVYRLERHRDRLGMRIDNPTNDRVVLLGNRSYVIDPRGETHAMRSLIIGPHSFTSMLLPPEPITITSYGWGGGWGWGWGWGPYPAGDPFFVDFYPPPVYATQLRTPYDWEWKTGTAKIHLTYERNRQAFDHDFEIIREPEKQK